MKQKRVRTLSLLVIFLLFFSLVANNTLAQPGPYPNSISADTSDIIAADEVVTIGGSLCLFVAALYVLRISALYWSESNLFRCRTISNNLESAPLVVNGAPNRRNIKKGLAGCGFGIIGLAMLGLVPYWIISIFQG